MSPGTLKVNPLLLTTNLWALPLVIISKYPRDFVDLSSHRLLACLGLSGFKHTACREWFL